MSLPMNGNCCASSHPTAASLEDRQKHALSIRWIHLPRSKSGDHQHDLRHPIRHLCRLNRRRLHRRERIHQLAQRRGASCCPTKSKMDGFFILDAKNEIGNKITMTRGHHRGGESHLTSATGCSAPDAALAAIGNLRLAITYDTRIFYRSIATGNSSPYHRVLTGPIAVWSAFGGLQNHHK